MRYFIITSGPAKGERFVTPNFWPPEQVKRHAERLSIRAAEKQVAHKEITAEQYADDEFEGEE